MTESSGGHRDTSPSTNDATEMATAYDSSEVEQPIYSWWEEQGFFKPSGSGQPFTIIMPPPNLTGELHIGSALFVTVEDIIIRWHRMRGHDTLWQPGVDHAAIAVNALVERQLSEENISRHDIGREQFLDRVWTFVNRSRDYISGQFRRLGASADWTREVFTMDPGPRRAVRATFQRLYEDGLIYRGERIINWCPDCGTALSDLEIEHRDEAGSWWFIRYAVLDDQGEPTENYLVIATTRPETIPADVAVAVNPNDERYTDLVGRQVLVPTTGRSVPIIADEAVSIEAGSGALKITPAHDPIDFEIGQRHQLPLINIIEPDGTLGELAGTYVGLERFKARDRIVADLESDGLIERVEPYAHAVGHCERSGTIVEPLVSEQWFVRIEPLARPAMDAVRDGHIRFVPPRFEHDYMHWLEEIRDWCISRQIWWGHRIPAWYCEACDGITVAIDDPSACSACGSDAIRQDDDTLDTWFSSGLWPHSALGWPDETESLQRYYPTQVMETGYDIIFFWVARMIMLSLYNMDGQIPFDTVYLHGLVRAADGSKMSKSSGNVVDPIQTIDEYGADALRFALVSGTSPGNDQRMTDQRLEAGRNFANKIWNASRFVLGAIESKSTSSTEFPIDTSEWLGRADEKQNAQRPVEDRWILSRTDRLISTTDELLHKFELGEAARQIRDFFWDEFADWYIELAKVRMRAGDNTPVPVLAHVLDRILRLLHPFMPFVTESVWQRLNSLTSDTGTGRALIVADFPKPESDHADEPAEVALTAVQDFVRAIRNIRAEKRVDASHWVEAHVAGAEATEAARSLRDAIEILARARPLHIEETLDEAQSEEAITTVLPVGQVVLPMSGLFDLEAERGRLIGQIEQVRADVSRLTQKLDNEQFLTRAPSQIVEQEQERLATNQRRLDGLERSLAEID